MQETTLSDFSAYRNGKLLTIANSGFANILEKFIRNTLTVCCYQSKPEKTWYWARDRRLYYLTTPHIPNGMPQLLSRELEVTAPKPPVFQWASIFPVKRGSWWATNERICFTLKGVISCQISRSKHDQVSILMSSTHINLEIKDSWMSVR